jgi:hypothetical protein
LALTQIERIAARYRRFAREEARGRSPLYERLAQAIADEPGALAFLAGLPADKQQPNLLLAAVRQLYGTPRDGAQLVQLIGTGGAAIAAEMLARRTQTNVPERCATLLPLLARLPQPLALIEVGASAGLCLLPDCYAYDYGSRVVPARSVGAAAPPCFQCRANPATPLPKEGVTVAWRAGLDLDPIEVSDADAVAWLETLVWPGEAARLENLRAAVAVARERPPMLHRGDLRRDLAPLVAAAPREATRVIFHTAVLAYLDPADRARFARDMAACDAVWISNENPRVFPEIAASVPETRSDAAQLLAMNGRPVAWTDPHGGWIEWLDGAPAP